MHSRLYEGWVRHRRLTPVHHEFRYPLWFIWLDLAELDTVFRGRWFWSSNRPALLRFKRSDHLGDPGIPLADSVRTLVEDKLGRRSSGPIRLLTQLRFAGFWINPVCFYYCYADDGETVDAIVAEVNNTPWNEQHCYVLDVRQPEQGSLAEADGAGLTQVKQFHVSPFMGMDQKYHWRLQQPEERLSVKLANYEQGQPIFEADLQMRRRELTTGWMAWMVIRYPFQTLRVFAAIYWQAFKLWWKKCPPYPHPKHRQQREPSPQDSPPMNSRPSPPSTAGAGSDSQITSGMPTAAR